jgi:hypothetical protein
MKSIGIGVLDLPKNNKWRLSWILRGELIHSQLDEALKAIEVFDELDLTTVNPCQGLTAPPVRRCYLLYTGTSPSFALLLPGIRDGTGVLRQDT